MGGRRFGVLLAVGVALGYVVGVDDPGMSDSAILERLNDDARQIAGVLVAVSTRIAQRARALPAWAVWASYAVAALSLTGFWSGGMASVAFALWLLGAVIAVLRAARRTPPASAVPAQGAPAPEAAR